MDGDVRRTGGQWHAADGAPADGFAPPGPPHLPRMARTGVHRRCAVTSDHTDASACALTRVRRVRRWLTWPRATSRSGRVPALRVKLYFLIRFSNLFFSSFLNYTAP
jgi:hypothetical protein